jgi:hypothetical protein
MAIIGNMILILILLSVLAFAGFMLSVLTEPLRRNPMKDAKRQADLDLARERAAAREAQERMRLLGQWADQRAQERRRP